MDAVNEKLLREIAKTYKDINHTLLEIKTALKEINTPCKKKKRVSTEEVVNAFFHSLAHERRATKCVSYAADNPEGDGKDKNAN